MSKPTLKDLNALAEKATPGPWSADNTVVHSQTSDGLGLALFDGPAEIAVEEDEANAALAAQIHTALAIANEAAAKLQDAANRVFCTDELWEEEGQCGDCWACRARAWLDEQGVE